MQTVPQYSNIYFYILNEFIKMMFNYIIFFH